MTFVDEYCAKYQDLFPDARSLEQFTALHLDMFAELPRKPLPAIARPLDTPIQCFGTRSPSALNCSASTSLLPLPRPVLCSSRRHLQVFSLVFKHNQKLVFSDLCNR